MEKLTPHYNLTEIQALVANPASQPFTFTALKMGLELGLTELEMRKIVTSLSAQNFYKSMTTNYDHTIWQDVYHGIAPDKSQVYIKVTHYTDGRPPVIQFKKK